MRRHRPLVLSASEASALAASSRSDSQTGNYTPKVEPGHPEYRERVAVPTMDAVDGMPAPFRALVHEYGYVDVYRAWKRGWSPDRVRESVDDFGVFAL